MGGTLARNGARLIGQLNAAVYGDLPFRIPRDLPNVTVGIGEIAAVAAIKGVLSRFENARTRRLRLSQDGVDFLAAARI
jgi:hypothetical protein